MKQTLKDFCSYPVLLIKACITLITSPKLLIYALIPYLIALIIFGISFYFGTKYIDDIVNLITEKASGFLYYVFGSLAFFIICIIASILSFVGMNTIGGFFIDLMLFRNAVLLLAEIFVASYIQSFPKDKQSLILV